MSSGNGSTFYLLTKRSVCFSRSASLLDLSLTSDLCLEERTCPLSPVLTLAASNQTSVFLFSALYCTYVLWECARARDS